MTGRPIWVAVQLDRETVRATVVDSAMSPRHRARTSLQMRADADMLEQKAKDLREQADRLDRDET
jgi:hypothetical protein